MTDYMFPPNARVSRLGWELMSNAVVHRSIFTGAIRSVDRTGDRWRALVQSEETSDRESYSTRAALKALRAVLRGPINRVWSFDQAYSPRGGLNASELLSNPIFASGTTGWTASAAEVELTVADRILRATRAASTADQTVRAAAASTAQWGSYAFRAFLYAGQGSLAYKLRMGTTAGAADIAESSEFTVSGLRTLVATVPGTSVHCSVTDKSAGRKTGDYYEIPYTSFARAAYIDVGANKLIRSDTVDNAAWVKTNTTVDADAFLAHTGTTSAERIRESTANAEHKIAQSFNKAAATEDWCFAVALRAGDQANARTFARIQLLNGANAGSAFFNLGTGAVGTVASAGTITNPRAFIRNLGGGWYYCALMCKIPSAITLVTAEVHLSTDGSTVSYAGSTNGDIGIYWPTTAQSSVPVQLVSTTASSSDGASPSFFTVLKGLPASVNGILLPNDRIEIITSSGSEYKIVTNAVNSDAAGLGFLKFSTPLRNLVSANAGVIFHQPLCRFALAEPNGGWDDRPGGFSDIQFDLEEDITDV